MVTKSREKLLYENLTYQIREACFNIWKEFGGTFKEKVIDLALTEELKSRGLEAASQKAIDIYYKGKEIATYTPNKIVNNSILLEIKCKPFLTKEDERQFRYYLKSSNCRVGLLINFGSKRLEIKRRVYDKDRVKSIHVEPCNYPRLSAFKERGITIIEFIVVISIILILTGIVFVNYRAGEHQLALQRAANKLAQDIRRAQEMAMSTKEFSGNIPAGGYGVYFDSQNPNYCPDSQPICYILYADINGDEFYKPVDDIIVEMPELEKGIFIQLVNTLSHKVSINIKPPDPTIKIKFPTLTGAVEMISDVEITLCLKGADCTAPSPNSNVRKILVNKSGLIEIK